MEEVKSQFGKLIKSDAIKAFWMFVFTTIITMVGDAIMQEITSGTYSLDSIHWKEIGLAVVASVLAYIKKQLFTNSQGEILTPEPAIKNNENQ